ncbi:hypothetical protein ACLOJK_014008 [Asimina triloba]
MPQFEEETARESHVIFLVVLCVILIFTITGGSLLVAYIVLPESRHTDWYPYVGIALVGIPWLFWFAAAAYRCIVDTDEENLGGLPLKSVDFASAKPYGTARIVDASPGDSPAGGKGAHLGGAAGDSPMGSPAGGRRVRFGGVVVLGSEIKDADDKPAVGCPVAQLVEERGRSRGLEGGAALTDELENGDGTYVDTVWKDRLQALKIMTENARKKKNPERVAEGQDTIQRSSPGSRC